MVELQDRDRELNDMMIAHQQQLVAWEQDRHRILVLEQKLTKAEGRGINNRLHLSLVW